MKRILGFAVVMITVFLPVYGQQVTSAESKASAPVAQGLGHDQRFRLAFLVRETDEKGKVLNSREYIAMIAAIPHRGDPETTIRTGTKVPIPTGPGSSQVTYVDLGINFDVNAFQVLSASRVGMNIRADLSSGDPTSDQTKGPPVIRQNRWSGDEQMVLGERKVIFSSDDLTSKNKVQVELTVTRVD
ncbi:MAG TPA: hypothetical protein VFE22_10170 [Edaphobacter sp.]|nr:hypothetical protein [Edaphobacter sp.]